MEKKKVIILIGSLCLILILAIMPFMAAYPNPATAVEKRSPIVLGIMAALTGTFANMGLSFERGFTVWVEKTNQEGGIRKHPVKYYFYDSQSDPTKAVLALKKLIETSNVHAVIGPNTTAEALAMAPVAEKAGVSLLSLSGSEVFEQKGFKYSFRPNISSGAHLGRVVAKVIRDIGSSKVAVLYDNTAWGKSILAIFEKEHVKDFGLEIVCKGGYDPDATEFGPQLSLIKASGAEFIFNTGVSLAGGLAIKQAREMGIKLPIITFAGLAAPEIISVQAILNAYCQEPGVYVTALKCDIWSELSKDDPVRIFVQKWAPTIESRYNIKLRDGEWRGVAYPELLRNAYERLLDEDPNIVGSGDLAKIRSRLRDKIETTKHFMNGIGFFTFSPTDHCGYEPESGAALTQWGSDRKLHYIGK